MGSDPRKHQTGAQKVTVLFSVLFAKMLTSSLFYNSGCDITCAFSDGDAEMSPRQCAERQGLDLNKEEADYGRSYNLTVGFLSALIAIPITLLLDEIFTHSQACMHIYVHAHMHINVYVHMHIYMPMYIPMRMLSLCMRACACVQCVHAHDMAYTDSAFALRSFRALSPNDTLPFDSDTTTRLNVNWFDPYLTHARVPTSQKVNNSHLAHSDRDSTVQLAVLSATQHTVHRIGAASALYQWKVGMDCTLIAC